MAPARRPGHTTHNPADSDHTPQNDTPADSPARWLLRNEFATVEVELDHQANSPRLKITNLRTGQKSYLDPLELERLTLARHADLAWIVSPAHGDTTDTEYPT
jgi:hypothetical protein